MKENHNSLNSCNSLAFINELHEFHLAAGELEFIILQWNNRIAEKECGFADLIDITLRNNELTLNNFKI